MDGVQGEPKKGFPTMGKLKKLPSLEEGGDGEGEEGGSFVGGGSRGMDKAGGGGEDEKKRRLSFTMGSNSSSSGNRRGSAGSGSQPCCQAEKCKVDLTDAKRYHRRHKVCEAHSKAPVVVVAGIRQRFCQQCSRFHELSEFDESKRSCRRRLAGHNERRRKVTSEPQGEDSSQCRQADQNGAAQINLSESTTFKHFQIR